MTDYFSKIEIASCAQHVEAKNLANKMWNKWSGLVLKSNDMAIQDEPPDRIIFCCEKADKVKAEFDKIRTGLLRCCHK